MPIMSPSHLGLLLTLTWISYVSAGSCREANLCCAGRDSACVVQKSPANSILEDLNEKPCYCDHACVKLGDCCSDFKEACGVQDCQVSPWGQWSTCDATCGSGSMERTRKVVRQPTHGGRHCPELMQRRACRAHHKCREIPEHLAKESAMLLPASLSLSRRLNETVDIRKTLRERNPDDPQYQTHREYCAVFEVLKASKSCHHEPEYKKLHEGSEVRVHCESTALRQALDWKCVGSGSEGRATRFTALAAPHCHGKWRLVTTSHRCELEPQYIFV